MKKNRPTVSSRPKSNGANSFIIHVNDDEEEEEEYRGGSSGVSISPARIIRRIRRILMRFSFYFASRGSSSSSAIMASKKQRNLEKFEPPKTSCSSNYSSYSHYNEAIADCIEFFNKSSQDQDQIGVEEGRLFSDANEMV